MKLSSYYNLTLKRRMIVWLFFFFLPPLWSLKLSVNFFFFFFWVCLPRDAIWRMCCTPSPLCMWPELCPDASIPTAVPLPFALSPGRAGVTPHHVVARTAGHPMAQALPWGPPSSLAALTAPLGKPSLGLPLWVTSKILPSRPQAALTVGVSVAGLQAAVLSLLGRRGEAGQENDSLLSYVTLMIRCKSVK